MGATGEQRVYFALKPDVSDDTRDRTLNLIGSWLGVVPDSVRRMSPDADPGSRMSRIYMLRLTPDANETEIVDRISKLPEVKYAEGTIPHYHH